MEMEIWGECPLFIVDMRLPYKYIAVSFDNLGVCVLL